MIDNAISDRRPTRYRTVNYLIEASGFEVACLKERWQLHVFSWNKVAETLRLPGSAMVGLFAETPITVRFTWANIDGHIIGFYRPVSLIVNYPMIERWIDDHLAPPKGNCETCRTTAANFGTVIDALGIRLKPTHNED